MTDKALLVLTLTAGILSTPPAHADVSVNIQVGTPQPPPPLAVAGPPRLVVVPGTSVYYVPSASFNLFVFGGRYYSFHHGVWFQANSHRGPWVMVAAEHVPKPVLAVPVAYYKIPPGHAKKLDGPVHGKGPKGKKGWAE
jgi:hypothetical protein